MIRTFALILLCWLAPATLVHADAVQERLDALVREHRLEGAALVVLRDGRELASYRSGSYSRGTTVPIASASKWLSTLVLARLVEQGRLRWQDPVGRWLPEAPSALRPITLAQLVSHTSGIDPDAGGRCSLRPAQPLQDCVRAILADAPASAPGSTFDYGGASMQLAARIAERAGGADFATLFAREVAKPLDLRDTRFGGLLRQPRRVANPLFGAGLQSNADDLARVMAMLSADGIGPGHRRYLRADTLDAMARDQVGDARRQHDPGAGISDGYGLGQWLHGLDAEGYGVRVSSPGAFGTTPWLDRDTGLAAVLVTRGRLAAMRQDVIGLQQTVARVHALD